MARCKSSDARINCTQRGDNQPEVESDAVCRTSEVPDHEKARVVPAGVFVFVPCMNCNLDLCDPFRLPLVKHAPSLESLRPV